MSSFTQRWTQLAKAARSVETLPIPPDAEALPFGLLTSLQSAYRLGNVPSWDELAALWLRRLLWTASLSLIVALSGLWLVTDHGFPQFSLHHSFTQHLPIL